jgi:hypothetical protein
MIGIVADKNHWLLPMLSNRDDITIIVNGASNYHLFLPQFTLSVSWNSFFCQLIVLHDFPISLVPLSRKKPIYYFSDNRPLTEEEKINLKNFDIKHIKNEDINSIIDEVKKGLPDDYSRFHRNQDSITRTQFTRDS